MRGSAPCSSSGMGRREEGLYTKLSAELRDLWGRGAGGRGGCWGTAPCGDFAMAPCAKGTPATGSQQTVRVGAPASGGSRETEQGRARALLDRLSRGRKEAMRWSQKGSSLGPERVRLDQGTRGTARGGEGEKPDALVSNGTPERAPRMPAEKVESRRRWQGGWEGNPGGRPIWGEGGGMACLPGVAAFSLARGGTA